MSVVIESENRQQEVTTPPVRLSRNLSRSDAWLYLTYIRGGLVKQDVSELAAGFSQRTIKGRITALATVLDERGLLPSPNAMHNALLRHLYPFWECPKEESISDTSKLQRITKDFIKCSIIHDLNRLREAEYLEKQKTDGGCDYNLSPLGRDFARWLEDLFNKRFMELEAGKMKVVLFKRACAVFMGQQRVSIPDWLC